MSVGHGGNIFSHARHLGCEPEAITDMSSNVNPFGPMPGLVEHLRERIYDITRLPEPDAGAMVAKVSRFYDIPRAHILAGNGTTQWIHLLPPALKSRNVLIAGPTYGEYAESCRAHGIRYREFFASAETAFALDPGLLERDLQDADTVFVCNPNNPTGRLTPGRELEALCSRHPETVFVVDESYLPFCDSAAVDTLSRTRLKNVLVLNSMSKIFRIPGLRIGFIMGGPALMDRIRPHNLPWSVNALAQAAVHFILKDPQAARGFIANTREKLHGERTYLTRRLSAETGLTLFPSVTSFVMVLLPGSGRAAEVVEALLAERLLVRNCDNFSGLTHRFVRLSLKDRDANQRLADALARLFPKPQNR